MGIGLDALEADETGEMDCEVQESKQGKAHWQASDSGSPQDDPGQCPVNVQDTQIASQGSQMEGDAERSERRSRI